MMDHVIALLDHIQLNMAGTDRISTDAGLYYVDTGEIGSHTAAHLHTAHLSASPKDVPTPMFDKWLEPHDSTTRNQILECMAYVILRSARPKLNKICWVYGKEGSGKSIMVSILEAICNDDGVAAIELTDFCSPNKQQYTHRAAPLAGKDCILQSDPTDMDYWEFSGLKALASWDSITYNPKGRDQEQ